MSRTWRLMVLVAAVAACGGGDKASPAAGETAPSADAKPAEPAEPPGPPEPRCEAGEAAACAEVAESLLAKDAGDKDAVEKLARACELGAETSCDRANTLRKSWLGYGHGPRKVAVLESLCKGGQLEACHDLAGVLADGVYTEQDDVRAIELFEAGCDAGRALDCLELADLQDWQAGELDVDRRLKLYGRACELEAESCAQLGELQRVHLDPDTAQVSAFASFEQACLAGSPTACKDAQKLVEVLEVPQARRDAIAEKKTTNREQHRAELTAACDAGDQSKCQQLARQLAFTPGDAREESLRKSLELSEPLCDAGDFHACMRLAQSYASGNAVQADTDRANTYAQKARDLATAGCDAGDPQGCQDLATMLRKDGEVDEALALSTRACDAGLRLACGGVAFETMNRGDKELTAQAHERACETGLARNCQAAARAYESGDGVDVDEEGAKALYARACAGGIVAACK